MPIQVGEKKQIKLDRDTIKGKRALATRFSSEIRSLYNAVLDSGGNNATSAEGYVAKRTLIEGYPNSFKTRFYTYLENESVTGATPASLDAIDIVLSNQGSTLDVQQVRQVNEFNQYCRIWCNSLIPLLLVDAD